MTITDVFFTSRERAESFAGSPDTAVISITDPGSRQADLHPLFGPILRLSFYDAVPADEYLPAPFPGLFDHQMAREVVDFIAELHNAKADLRVMVHCEYGVSRSAAVALFIEAYAGARLSAREFGCDANHWVLDRLTLLHPHIEVDIPQRNPSSERRAVPRP